MITQIETMVLERMSENLSTPDVWSGQGDQVRTAVQSAIDELLALGLFHKEFVQIELSAGKSVYLMTEVGTVIGVLSARIESQTRILEHRTLAWISAQDRLFLKTRGTPWTYTVLDFKKILVYPTPSLGGDVLELECFMIPDPYVGGEWASEVPGELTEAIVSLAFCNLQMLVPGGLPTAVQAFQDFMQMVPWASEQRKAWNSYMHFYQKGLGNGNGS